MRTVLGAALLAPAVACGGGLALPARSVLQTATPVRFELGASYRKAEREFRINGGPVAIESREFSAHAAVALFRGVELDAELGMSEVKPAPLGSYSPEEAAWTLGLRLGLLDLPVEVGGFDSAWWRVGAFVSYGERETDFSGATLEWSDLRAALLVGFEAHASVWTDPTDTHSTLLYVGPAYSSIDGSYGDSNDVEAGDEVGLTAGIDGRWKQRFLVGLQVTRFDATEWRATLGWRF